MFWSRAGLFSVFGCFCLGVCFLSGCKDNKKKAGFSDSGRKQVSTAPAETLTTQHVSCIATSNGKPLSCTEFEVTGHNLSAKNLQAGCPASNQQQQVQEIISPCDSSKWDLWCSMPPTNGTQSSSQNPTQNPSQNQGPSVRITSYYNSKVFDVAGRAQIVRDCESRGGAIHDASAEKNPTKKTENQTPVAPALGSCVDSSICLQYTKLPAGATVADVKSLCTGGFNWHETECTSLHLVESECLVNYNGGQLTTYFYKGGDVEDPKSTCQKQGGAFRILPDSE